MLMPGQQGMALLGARRVLVGGSVLLKMSFEISEAQPGPVPPLFLLPVNPDVKLLAHFPTP